MHQDPLWAFTCVITSTQQCQEIVGQLLFHTWELRFRGVYPVSGGTRIRRGAHWAHLHERSHRSMWSLCLFWSTTVLAFMPSKEPAHWGQSCCLPCSWLAQHQTQIRQRRDTCLLIIHSTELLVLSCISAQRKVGVSFTGHEMFNPSRKADSVTRQPVFLNYHVLSMWAGATLYNSTLLTGNIVLVLNKWRLLYLKCMF